MGTKSGTKTAVKTEFGSSSGFTPGFLHAPGDVGPMRQTRAKNTALIARRRSLVPKFVLRAHR